MDMASKRVNELLLSDDIITRWHIEIVGDENGNYLTAINLLSYFQFPVGDLKSLNEVQNYVSRKLAHLLSRANRVIKVADKSEIGRASCRGGVLSVVGGVWCGGEVGVAGGG